MSKSSRTIKLAIAILKSDDPHPQPDPVLRTLGGPGASSLKMVRGRKASPWLRDRDLIIFEQRGTKYSQPALECPEVNDANIASAKNRLGRARSKKNEVTAARVCYERLTKSGVDLNGYNSAESAADIEDLRRVLKIDKLNLYGVSYSARLMLDVMRYYPGGIRSVVLESTLPPEINYDEVGVDGIVRSLNELFTSCESDGDCNEAFPDVEKEFYAVVTKLNREPISVPTKDPKSGELVDIRLNGDDFATWIVDYLFSSEPAATVEAPYVIHQAFAGNLVDQFKRYAGDKLSGSFYSWGMRYSFWCGEEMPFEDVTKIKAQSSKYPGLKGYEVMALPDICSVWKVKPARPIANQPVTSVIPTLVLAAQYDAYTDPAWGKAVADRLRNSYFVEIPWAGHGPGFSVPCVGTMIADFFDDPSAKPTSDCVEKTKAQFKFLLKK
jgi:pimeloyl-ACP methyl ester carboxylesterase